MVGKTGERPRCRAQQASRATGRALVLGVALAACWAGCGSPAGDPSARAGARGPEPEASSAPPPAAGPLSPLCDALRAKLNWSYTVVRQCERDQDCNYVRSDFTIVSRAETDVAVTSSYCGQTAPLLKVANGARTAAQTAELNQAYFEQARACAEPPSEDDGDFPCTSRSEIRTSAQPLCQRGQCEPPPGVWRP